jgi:hypothetical protein
VVAVAAGAIGAACAPEVQQATNVVAPEGTYKPKAHAPGPMEGVRATRMGEQLAAAGLDVRNLPPIEALTPAQKQKVMRTFTETLGVPCLGCHAEDQFPADTRRKRIAKRMYNEIVRVLTLRDGEPVYCDSCHDGNMFMLDRRDTRKLTKHMGENLVGQMARVDGKNHDCSTCHGDPPDFQMLTTWKRTTAPDILLPGAEATGTVVTPPLPADGPRHPEDCGPKSDLCPLQQWMRGYVAIATSTSDAPSLAKALDRVALFSPDATWSWAAISKGGADAARRGDLTAAKESCKKCHELYRGPWRESHRTRPAP